eukprot:gb/GECH01008052.1/.p1 GENE.gb/GECH01008052.1/~~gb/GECH01008052.1/.p1  ORF type:complete len:103 (+),score=21.42 gb/GECH01008052.1/:1-309(+)
MSNINYWTVSEGKTVSPNTTCRECRQPIPKGTPAMCRDGRRIRLFYHKECFSGEADPRTQNNSSYGKRRKYPSQAFQSSAPQKKGTGKWSTSYGVSGKSETK